MIKLSSILNEIKLNSPKPFELKRFYDKSINEWWIMLVTPYGMLPIDDPLESIQQNDTEYKDHFMVAPDDFRSYDSELLDFLKYYDNDDLSYTMGGEHHYRASYIPIKYINVPDSMDELPLVYPEDEKYLDND